MCILPRASTPVVPTSAAPAGAAHLEPQQRQELAVAALTGARPVSQLGEAFTSFGV